MYIYIYVYIYIYIYICPHIRCSLEESMSIVDGPLFQIDSPPVRTGGAPETPAPPVIRYRSLLTLY